MESILTSVKKLLGIAEEYEQFDADLIMHINTVFMILTQLGVGPAQGFIIEDKSTDWTEFIEDPVQLQALKSYMYLRVKVIFDPPLSSSVLESMNRMIAEFEWRLRLGADSVG